MGSRKYKELDLAQFNPIKKADTSYFLGILATDGNLYIKNDTTILSFGFQIKDLGWLKLIRKLLGVNNKIGIYKAANNKQYCYLAISCKGLEYYLNKYSITVRKSLTIKYPKFLNKNLTRHFIRGVFEGDGCISFKYNQRNQGYKQSVSICSASKQFLAGIKKALEENNIYCNKIRCENREKSNRNNLYTLSIKANSFIDFYKFLYKGSNHFLKRKKDKFKQLVKHRRRKAKYNGKQERHIRLRKILTKSYLQKYVKQGKAIIKLAKQLKVNRTTVYNHIRKLGIKLK